MPGLPKFYRPGHVVIPLFKNLVAQTRHLASIPVSQQEAGSAYWRYPLGGGAGFLGLALYQWSLLIRGIHVDFYVWYAAIMLSACAIVLCGLGFYRLHKTVRAGK